MPEVTPKLDPSWLAVLADQFEQPYMQKLRAFLAEDKKTHTIYPAGPDMFNAYNYTPFDQVRVVILGQDPYHGPNQAHGLSFSVPVGEKVPPSLVNIFKELSADLGVCNPGHGYLAEWARRGVFLLNASLTVRAGLANSHKGKGWESFTTRTVEVLNEQRDHLVFMLWGSNAQKNEGLIDHDRHLVLTCPHPSPLSASRGFFGCRHFSIANSYLQTHGYAPIDWQLSTAGDA